MKFIIKNSAFFLVVYLALQLPVMAKEVKCQSELHDGKIKIYNYLLEPKYPIDQEVYISCEGSADGRWIGIKSGYRADVDIWLYDSYTKQKPIRINTDPGNNTIIKFHGNKAFEVRWGGMGYRMSDFFEVDKPETKVHKDDVLTYFDELDVYVGFYEDGIEIGKIFEKGTPEKFYIDFDLTNDFRSISPLFLIDKVRIDGKNLIISYHKKNGKHVTAILKPNVLQGNTAQLEHEIK